nr:hypothetical protein [uncultured Draconibacterium sp.]
MKEVIHNRNKVSYVNERILFPIAQVGKYSYSVRMRKGKFNCLLLLFLLVLPGVGFAQVQTNGKPAYTITNENPFFDASTSFNDGVNIGKGLVFPRTDLTVFTFRTGSVDGINFPTAFDGMIVYNSGTGNTVSGQGQVTEVAPGFYYFSNPAGTTSVTNGKWVRIADGTDVITGKSTSEIVENGTALATGGQIYDFTLQSISDSIQNLQPMLFEKELITGENNIDVGFSLNENVQVLYNGQAISKSQWTGIGSTVIHLNLATKSYDNLTVKR